MTAVSVALMLAASTTSAGPMPREGSIELSPMVGYEWFGKRELLDNSVYLGLRGGYNVTKHFAAELSLGLTPTHVLLPPPDKNDVSVWNVETDLVYHIMRGWLTPYATAGGGLQFNSEPKFEDGAGSLDIDPMIGVGVGVKAYLTDWFGVRLDARHRLTFDRPPYRPREGADELNYFHNTIISAGLLFQLGGAPDDADGDGIEDDADKCPDEPEDADGFEDGDGCPELDNDGDGIPDSGDKCPDEAEDKDKFEDTDGCPDPDNDQDGILDGADKCPNKAELKNGYEDEDGCPEVDTDGDGIFDPKDACVSEPEDMDGFEDEDGCPEADNDGDGIPDDKDAAPNEPETFNSYLDEDGAPDVVPEKLKAFAGAVKGINFRSGSDRLTPQSLPTLRKAAATLKEFPDLKVEVQGHTDNVGEAAASRDLSTRRAESVKTFLVQVGVPAERLTAVGFGPDKPVDAADTDEARAKNRRVEFKLTK